MSLFSGPEYEAFADHVRGQLPKITESAFGLIPVSLDDLTNISIDFAVQLGLLILADKPIILCVPPGTQVPSKLIKVADEILELEMGDPHAQDRLREAIVRMFEKIEQQ